jgi:hypothetical protein
MAAVEGIIVPSRCISWLRCALLAGLCYSLVLQTLLMQAAATAAAAGTEIVICHGNGDQNPGDTGDDSQARCDLCWLPASGAALLPETGWSAIARTATGGLAYRSVAASFIVVKPPPRGASRAPPRLA